MGPSAILFLVFTVSSYIFLIALFLAAGQEKVPTSHLIEFPVSIVVAARNAANNIEQLVRSLNEQRYSVFEIIIVDDRSTDGTSTLLEKLKNDYSRLKLVRVEQVPETFNPKKYAITQGIQKAKHKIILLTDADCLPASPLWISEMVSGFDEETQIVLGFSTYEKKPGWLNYFIRYETLLTGIQYLGSALLGNPYMGVGRNLAYRKSFFLKNKGFDGHENITGGDDDLFVNKNASSNITGVVIGKESLVSSQPKTTLNEYLHQKLRHLSTGKKYQLKDKVLLGLFNLSFLGSLLILLILIGKSSVLYWLASFLLVRWLLIMAVIGRWSKMLGVRFNVIGIPLLDILYLFYYIFTGTRALFIKKVKWT